MVIDAALYSEPNKSLGDKQWVFTVNEDTVFGYITGEGFSSVSKAEFASKYTRSFPVLTLAITDGLITRAYTSS